MELNFINDRLDDLPCSTAHGVARTRRNKSHPEDDGHMHMPTDGQAMQLGSRGKPTSRPPLVPSPSRLMWNKQWRRRVRRDWCLDYIWRALFRFRRSPAAC